ncbi:rod shape-determining protein RodA [Bacteroidia bacterium]|nr:rod shape-determining protein RodA [Bacteroidia bacterium]
MSFRRTNIWAELDWVTVALYVVFVIAGWFSIYAATYDFDHASIFDLTERSGKQLIWILVSVVVGISLLVIESSWYEVFAIWIYFFIIVLLIVTIFIAPEIKGSRSWLVLGPVSLQPAEFAKFATALAVGRLMSTYRFNLMRGKSMLSVLLLVMLPMALIFAQHETGSALVFLAFFLVFYREGMSGTVLFSGGAAILFFVLVIRYGETMFNAATPLSELMVLSLIVLFLVVLLVFFTKNLHLIKYCLSVIAGISLVAGIINRFVPFNLCWAVWTMLGCGIIYLVVMFFKERKGFYLGIVLFAVCSSGFLYSVDYVSDNMLKQHQRERIQVALGVIEDPSGRGYNVNQSKIAIGSGGVVGKGALNGTQTKLKYVPEQDTDFIFCTIGEEEGFLGTVTVLALFLVLLTRLIYLADRQKSTFHRVYGYSVVAILFFHVAVNIGMVVGVTPVIGIPLPFFSYGGSSLLAFTMLLFIFLKLDAARSDRL